MKSTKEPHSDGSARGCRPNGRAGNTCRDDRSITINDLCIAGTQIIFWTFTYPANQETSNWTVLPEHWEALRTQWEYSHAASAVLNLIALIMLVLSVLAAD